MKIDFDINQIITWAFEGMITGGAVYAASAVKDIKKTFGKVQVSIETLNQNVAVIIEKTTWHEKTLEKHDERLRELEIHTQE